MISVPPPSAAALRAPAIVVHGLDHALAALAPGRAVLLLSGVAAGCFAGAPWWRALIARARAAYPGTEMADLLDCADSPAAALAALRAGQLAIGLGEGSPARWRVVAAAAESGAVLFARRPPALDLGLADRGALDPFSPRAARLIAAWLMTEPAPLR